MINLVKLNESTELCSLFEKYGSDKSGGIPNWIKHNYSIYYFKQFAQDRLTTKKVFELGLGTNNTDVPSNMGENGKPGASLFAWRDFFPNAQIIGADIDTRVLFHDDRIATYYCDQTNKESIQDMWTSAKVEDGELDVIVEDGYHNFKANICFLENSLHKLKVGGHYIIEDVETSMLGAWEVRIDQIYFNKYPNFEFRIIQIDFPENSHDNNLIHVIRRK